MGHPEGCLGHRIREDVRKLFVGMGLKAEKCCIREMFCNHFLEIGLGFVIDFLSSIQFSTSGSSRRNSSSRSSSGREIRRISHFGRRAHTDIPVVFASNSQISNINGRIE